MHITAVLISAQGSAIRHIAGGISAGVFVIILPSTLVELSAGRYKSRASFLRYCLTFHILIASPPSTHILKWSRSVAVVLGSSPALWIQWLTYLFLLRSAF